MTIDAHNNSKNIGKMQILTLGDLYAFIGGLDLPTSKKAPMRSAIKQLDMLLGHGCLDLPAQPKVIFAKLEDWSPAMAGMTEGSFANMKSRVRAAFRLAQPNLVKPRSRTALTGSWGALQKPLDTPSQRSLSRLFHFAASQDWEPNEISDAHIQRFASYLQTDAMVIGWERVLHGTIKAWNLLACSGQPGGLQALTPPVMKRTSYWIPLDEWPASLRADLEALLKDLTNPSSFKGTKIKKVSPNTAVQYRSMVITLVSASVMDGACLAEFGRLADAVAPDNVVRALDHLSERAGDRVSPTMIQMLIRIQTIARWCGLPKNDLTDLKDMLNGLHADAEVQGRKKRQMAPKNRTLLDRMDDQHFRDLVTMLPDTLVKKALKKPDNRWTPAAIRAALAIELLLVCSMRRENLVKLRLGSSIKRMGKSPNHSWVIRIEGKDVKTLDPLTYTLPASTSAMLEAYLSDWRPKLCNVPNDWLFSSCSGGPIDPRTMASSVASSSRRVLGVAVSPHQFRHLSAESFLLDNPDKLFTISQHLGHRDPNTTRTYYVRSKQREASRDYQKTVLRNRQNATLRIKGRGRRRSSTGSAPEGSK